MLGSLQFLFVDPVFANLGSGSSAVLGRIVLSSMRLGYLNLKCYLRWNLPVPWQSLFDPLQQLECPLMRA